MIKIKNIGGKKFTIFFSREDTHFPDYDRVKEVVEKFVSSNSDIMYIDLAELTIINSATLGILLLLRNEISVVKNDNFNITIINLDDNKLQTLKRSNFDKLFNIE